MHFFFRGLAFFTLLGCIACANDGTKDIRAYYFPLNKLQDGMVYEYRAVQNDSLAPNYWYFRSVVLDTGAFLTGTYYRDDLTPLQFTREQMLKNGMLLRDLYLYETDSTGKAQRTEAEIIAGSVFPFEVRDSGGIFLYNVSWQTPSDPDATMRLIKNRRYAGDTTIVWQERSYDCVVFTVRELLEHNLDGYFEREFSTVEWYAKGIGLIYYRKEITADFVLEYRLHDRYPMENLEALFRQKIEQ